MSDKDISPSARISAAFEKLRTSASQIKTVSDELSRHVAAIERALARLNLHVACWALISERKFSDDSYKREYIGYREHDGRWCIVVNMTEGFESSPDEEDQTTWAFDDAPQYLRGKAIDKLPELIEALVTTVDKTTERLKMKVPAAEKLASVATTLTLTKKKVTP
jgi:hypothetical protein